MTTTQKTSLEAYELFKPKIPNDHEAILAVLSVNSDLTYKEIGKLLRWTQFDPNKVSRRMAELVRADKVEISGTRICSIGKRTCSTYRLAKEIPY